MAACLGCQPLGFRGLWKAAQCFFLLNAGTSHQQICGGVITADADRLVTTHRHKSVHVACLHSASTTLRRLPAAPLQGQPPTCPATLMVTK